MRPTFQFDPALHRIPSPEPLSNTEREILQDLAAPGLPLWKILRELHDYREGLIVAMAQPGNDLDDKDTRKRLKRVQSDIGALTAVLEKFNAALQTVPEAKEQGQ